MNKRFYLLSLIILSNLILKSQLTILKNIGSGDDNGLGSTFDYQISDTKDKVFFEGSLDGFDYTIWKSDGTPNGTVQAVTSNKINNSDAIYFTKNGIFVTDFNNGRKLLLSKGTDASTSNIPFFDGKPTGAPYAVGNKTIFIGTSTKDIHVTDGTNAGSKLIKTLDAFNYNLVITTSDSLALIFDSYSFGPDFTPFLYQSNGDKIIDLIDYLKPYKSFVSIDYAYIFNEVIMFQAIEDGFQKYYAFNVNTKQLKPFDFIRKFVSGSVMENGDYLILSERYLHKINPTTLNYEELYSEVYPFTTSYFKDGKLYFIADPSGGKDIYFESDGTKSGTKPLVGALIGDTYYESRCIIFNNDFYYFNSDGNFFNSAYYLMKYDLNSKLVDTVGSIQEPSGGAVYTQGIFELNGNLYVSKFTVKEGHELYKVDVETNILELIQKENEVSIYPTIAFDHIKIKGNDLISDFQIIDLKGKVIQEDSSYNDFGDDIEISHLIPGFYLLRITDNRGILHVLKFIKSL